jgi:hypothetical protein
MDLIGCRSDAHESQHGGLTLRQGQASQADHRRLIGIAFLASSLSAAASDVR